MLRVVKIFAKPLKDVTENGKLTIRKLRYGFLFAFRSNCGRIFSRFDTIHERDGHPAIHRRTTANAALMHSIARQKPIF